jgi:hypothetical protein
VEKSGLVEEAGEEAGEKSGLTIRGKRNRLKTDY